MQSLPLQILHNHRDALAAADAGGREPVFRLAPAQLVQQRDQQARAGRTQRMPQRDRAAVDVDFAGSSPSSFQLRTGAANASFSRSGRCRQCQPGLFQRNALAGTGPEPMTRLHAGDPPAHNASERMKLRFFGIVKRHHDHRRATIDDAAGVARGHCAVLTERRASACQALQRGLRTPMIVLGEHLSRRFAPLLRSATGVNSS